MVAWIHPIDMVTYNFSTYRVRTSLDEDKVDFSPLPSMNIVLTLEAMDGHSLETAESITIKNIQI